MSATVPCWATPLTSPLPPLWLTVILNPGWSGPRPDLRLIHAAGIGTYSWQIVAIND